MQEMPQQSSLCYVEATRLQSSAGTLAGLDVQGADEEKIGRLDGVLIDPVERRLRFFVVKRPVQWGSRRYLLPTDFEAHILPDERALRLEINPSELVNCQEFHESSVSEYSDADFLASLFRQRIA